MAGLVVVGGAGEKWTVESRCDVYGPSATVESTFATRLRRARPRIRRGRACRARRGRLSVQDLPGQAFDLQTRAVVTQPGRIALGPGGVRGESGQLEIGEDLRAQELRQGEVAVGSGTAARVATAGTGDTGGVGGQQGHAPGAALAG